MVVAKAAATHVATNVRRATTSAVLTDHPNSKVVRRPPVDVVVSRVVTSRVAVEIVTTFNVAGVTPRRARVEATNVVKARHRAA